MTNIEVKEALVAANHILANNEAAVADITRIITNHETSGKRPFYIYCGTTGAKLGMSQQVVYEKRLAKYEGNMLAMFAQYKGRGPKVAVAPAIEVEVIAPEEGVRPDNGIVIDVAEVEQVAPAMLALPEAREEDEVIEVAEVTAEEAEVATEG